jgi:hypothetical protein
MLHSDAASTVKLSNFEWDNGGMIMKDEYDGIQKEIIIVCLWFCYGISLEELMKISHDNHYPTQNSKWLVP